MCGSLGFYIYFSGNDVYTHNSITVLDGGQDVCGDAEPTGLIRNMSNTVEAETQTDPTPFACTHPVMRCVEVAMDNVDFAAMHHAS